MKIGKKSSNALAQYLGFTYIGLMIMVAISGIALAVVGIVWHQDAQREREKELLFIGDSFREAIGSYYNSSPSGIKQYPKKLNDLLLDNRFPNIKRHIRKLYKDPVSQEAEWELVIKQNQIIGLYSRSGLKPIKRRGFPPKYELFNDANEYGDWKFIYTPGT